MLILSHRDELVHQPAKYFDCSFGFEQAKETSHGEEIISASVQSLVRRLDKFRPDDFDVLVTDEAHHAVAPTYRKIYDFFKPRLHLGFTATPNRFDKQGLGDIYQDIIYDHNLKWGIENNYLSNIRWWRIEFSYNLSKVKTQGGDFELSDLDRTINIESANRGIVKAYEQWAKPPCLIFCASIDHAENLANLINGAVAVKGGEDRSEIVQAFSEGKIPCLTNCMVFTEGTDLPNINTVIIARPTKNKSLYQQMVGRGTRLFPGKEYLILIDCIGKIDTEDLCTAPNLFGVDTVSVPDDVFDDFQGEDLVNVSNKIFEFNDTPEVWIKNAYYMDLWADNAGYDLHGINFFKRPDGSLIVGDFYLPPPDQLGRINWDNKLMPAQQAIDEVFSKLQKDYKNQEVIWNRKLIQKSWGFSPASEKQIAMIKKFAPDFDISNLSKFQANQIIQGHFSHEPATKNQCFFLKKQGINAVNLTKQAASKIIAKIKGGNFA